MLNNNNNNNNSNNYNRQLIGFGLWVVTEVTSDGCLAIRKFHQEAFQWIVQTVGEEAFQCHGHM